ncbi:hypothetical protein [Ruegeria pomeroyi]|uniref:hypothetical protein n=1 Tax=Ruegeria pomeroyi TaxID=89184 RepID=UPI001182114A|nr:hypothetical protein [Ruegeria pomeroyi]
MITWKLVSTVEGPDQKAAAGDPVAHLVQGLDPAEPPAPQDDAGQDVAGIGPERGLVDQGFGIGPLQRGMGALQPQRADHLLRQLTAMHRQGIRGTDIEQARRHGGGETVGHRLRPAERGQRQAQRIAVAGRVEPAAAPGHHHRMGKADRCPRQTPGGQPAIVPAAQLRARKMKPPHHAQHARDQPFLGPVLFRHSPCPFSNPVAKAPSPIPSTA